MSIYPVFKVKERFVYWCLVGYCKISKRGMFLMKMMDHLVCLLSNMVGKW